MRIAIAGGDLRMQTVYELFARSGCVCEKHAQSLGEKFSSDTLKNADAVILPLPCCKGGYLFAPMSDLYISIGDVFASGGESTLFFGGNMPFVDERHVDYAVCEELLLKNALVTAEAAISLATTESKSILIGSDVTILGYGRIGKCLSRLLIALGCNVTVAARRRESRAEAEILGCNAVGFDCERAFSVPDIIFNTVPFTVMGEKELSLVKQNPLLIDLASGAGGIDASAAERAGIKYIHALALPGKYAPETAGKIIFDTVFALLAERGMM